MTFACARDGNLCRQPQSQPRKRRKEHTEHWGHFWRQRGASTKVAQKCDADGSVGNAATAADRSSSLQNQSPAMPSARKSEIRDYDCSLVLSARASAWPSTTKNNNRAEPPNVPRTCPSTSSAASTSKRRQTSARPRTRRRKRLRKELLKRQLAKLRRQFSAFGFDDVDRELKRVARGATDFRQYTWATRLLGWVLSPGGYYRPNRPTRPETSAKTQPAARRPGLKFPEDAHPPPAGAARGGQRSPTGAAEAGAETAGEPLRR